MNQYRPAGHWKTHVTAQRPARSICILFAVNRHGDDGQDRGRRASTDYCREQPLSGPRPPPAEDSHRTVAGVSVTRRR
jgi:hypothetical protein